MKKGSDSCSKHKNESRIEKITIEGFNIEIQANKYHKMRETQCNSFTLLQRIFPGLT